MTFKVYQSRLFFGATAVFLLAGLVSTTCASPISATKDSADFNTKNLEGDVLPTATNGDVSDWSVSGGEYTVVQDAINGTVGMLGGFSSATGWTTELRVKLDKDNLPTDAEGALHINMSDDADDYFILSLNGDASNVTLSSVNSSGPQTLLFTGSVDDYHTIRLAKEAGTDHVHLYVNDTEIAASLAAGFILPGFNQQRVGDAGNAVDDGTVFIDYIRFDTSGGFAPATNSNPLPGDFNDDQIIDSQDLGIWETGFGITGTALLTDGDADLDGDVDGIDFLIWQRNFAPAGSPAVGAAVPEPASAFLLISGMVMLLSIGHRKLCP